MAGRVGRTVAFFFGGNSPGDQILGVREKGVELNGDPIDLTSDENAGLRTLLENTSAEDQINISLSGVTKDTRLKQAWHAGERTQTCLLTYPDGSSLAGSFFLSSYSESDTYNDAATFEASLMSSGLITYTPAP